jgi:drug/metabolite transporter (DMT)-like permease
MGECWKGLSNRGLSTKGESMVRGVLLGILLQCISAAGYLVIANVTSIKSELFRTGVMICSASVVALIATIYFLMSGQQELTAIRTREYVSIAAGSIMVMFVAQAIYFAGVKASNMTTMGYTMLAFPVISLILELVLGRVKPSSIGTYDLAGFALMAAGYVVIMSKPVPQ